MSAEEMTLEKARIDVELVARSEKDVRSVCLLANFQDGFAAGWVFDVPQAFSDMLDTRVTGVSRKKKAYSIWTQGRCFCFQEGNSIHAKRAGLSVVVESASPAGGVQVGSITTSPVDYVHIDKDKRKDDFGEVRLVKNKYDPGEVVFSLHRLSDGGWEKKATFNSTQVEFVKMLQSGVLVTPDGVIDVVHAYSVGEQGEPPANFYSKPGRAVSMTEALKTYDIDCTAAVAFVVMIGAGVLAERGRYSDSKNAEVFYKVLTPFGLHYGRNMPTPADNEETAPRFYIDRFGPLAKLVREFLAGNMQSRFWSVDVSDESEECQTDYISAVSRRPLGTEDWSSKRVQIWRDLLGVKLANSLHLIDWRSSASGFSYLFFEYDLDHRLVGKYEARADGESDSGEPVAPDWSRYLVSWQQP